MPPVNHEPSTTRRPGDAAADARTAPGEGAIVPDPPPGGTPFGRYVLQARLGEGGMGVVWRAWDPELSRPIALKQVLCFGEVPRELADRFAREARLAASLHHPHIVALRDAGLVGGCPFLAMDLVEGRAWVEDLPPVAAREGGPPPDLRRHLRILAQVAAAAGYAHRQGVVHRDLKPANVLIDARGDAFVTDFGLARNLGDDVRLTRTGESLGTPGYMSPEQRAGLDVGPTADVWSLGVILYQLLTGLLPWPPEDLDPDRLLVPPPSPSRVRTDVPADLEAVCLRALDPEPAARFADAGEFADELERWLAGKPVRTKPPGVWRQLRRTLRQPRVAIPAAAALLVLGTLLWGLSERNRQFERQKATLETAQREAERLEDDFFATPMSQENRDAAASQVLALLDLRIKEEPSLASAWAWRGHLRHLTGRAQEAAEDLDRACALAPDGALPHLLRCRRQVDLYSRRRAVPPVTQNRGVARIGSLPAESAGERSLREGAERDLAIARIGVREGAFPAEWLPVLHAELVLRASAPDSPKQALEMLGDLAGPRADRLRSSALLHLARFRESVEASGRALTRWPEDTSARLLHASAQFFLGRERLGRGENGHEDFLAALATLSHPMDPSLFPPSVHRMRGELHGACAERALATGADPEPAFGAAFAAYEAALAAGDFPPSVLRSRAVTLGVRAASRGRRGVDPLPDLQRQIADLTAALDAGGDRPDLLRFRAHARAQAAFPGRSATEFAEGMALALADVDEAIRREPSHADGYLCRSGLRATLAEQALAG